MNHARCSIAFMLTLTAAIPALSQAASLEEMEQRCQNAREAKIAPLREAAITDCTTRRRTARSPAACERFYADFGQGGAIVDGRFRPPMFIDLPECVEYFEAKDTHRRNSSRR